ncbi:MAG TPA: hypothetical protein VKY85_07645 [Candidatus Angelobacter sp.]|nr:hypothetical protein [Candidatus Angelobacter sp.]
MSFGHQGALDASAIQDILSTLGPQFNSTALSNATLTQGLMTGGFWVNLTTTANGANALTTRTAAQLFADLQASLSVTPPANFTYMLRITNTGNNTVTLTAGAGVTINGTATIATNTFRDFMVTVNNAGQVTIQSVGVGTIS